MVIRYCDRCGQRVEEDDVASGRAVEVDKERVFCAACAESAPKGAVARAPGAQESPRPSASPGKGSQRRWVTSGRESRRGLAPASSSRSLPRQTVRSNARSAPSSNRTLCAVGIVAGVVVLVAVVALVLHGRAEERNNLAREGPTSSTSNGAAPGDLPPRPNDTGGNADSDYDPRALTAASLLEQARAYRKASPQDPWGLVRRLNELQERYADTPAAREAAKLSRELNLPVSVPARELPPESDWGRAISLLERVDPSADANGTAWTREGASVISPRQGGPSAMLTLPYRPADEYDVRVVFARRDGQNDIGVLLPRHGKPICLILGGWGNSVHGFEVVNGMRADSHPANLRRQGLIDGTPQTLVVQVRHVLFKAWLDGQLLAECKAEDGQISVHEIDWKPVHPDRLTLGAWQTIYEVRQVQVIERTGKGTMLR